MKKGASNSLCASKRVAKSAPPKYEAHVKFARFGITCTKFHGQIARNSLKMKGIYQFLQLAAELLLWM
jgi:hypothetical protein